MSKKGYISRYLLIIKKLKAKSYISYEELKRYIENQIEFLQMMDDQLSIGFSIRTLQRDIKEISNNFGIDIEYSRSGKGYHIIQSESENMNFQRMMEAFDMFNSLNLSQDLAPFIDLEKRKPLGTENLYGLLHAIKNKLQIKFAYHKYCDDESSFRIAEPYAMKEFKNRWYVMAKDKKDNNVKSFSLDRLSGLEITNTRFIYPENYNILDRYRYCFGIIDPNKDEPEEIILSFDPIEGKYIKSLPLHSSQQILIDNEQELRLKLKLFVTYDLIMELLSHGYNLKVLQPESLIEEIRSVHERAFKQYS